MQFGFAIIPLWLRASLGFISGTTRGTPSSILKAEELSITTAPALAAALPNSFEIFPPALKRAISIPSNELFVSSCMTISSLRKLIVLPADRTEARGLSSLTGKSLLSRQFNISCPTAPVIPTIAILSDAMNFFFSKVFSRLRY